MKKRYEIGDKVKLFPESAYVYQSAGTTGQIMEFRYPLPEKDADFLNSQFYYRVQFENGELNSYRYIDLIPAEETIKKEEKTLKQQAIERFGFISKDDKFTILDGYQDRTVKEEDPSNWTEIRNYLWLGKSGEGGLCIHHNGIWSERASLPKNWAVKCNRYMKDQKELTEWRNSSWSDEGYIDPNKMWYSTPDYETGIITYDQFIKWVYNPWKKQIDDSIKPGDWVIGWHHSECELYHTPWKVEKFDKSGTYAIPEGHPGWNCNISHLIKVPAAPQQSPSSMEEEWKPKFKIGDRVQVIDQSDGWGDIEYGDIGVVVHVPKNKHGVYKVDFDKASGWNGTEKCFILEESAPKDESTEGEFVYSPPMVKIITTNGISSEFKNEQSINLLIHKPKKVKQLKLN